MSKKHIRIGCALLALVLVLTAGIVVLNTEAAEVLTMPKERGLARMSKTVYDLYMEGEISQEDFAAYLPAFDFSHRLYTESWVSGWSNRFTVTKPKGKSGLQGATITTTSDDFSIWVKAPTSLFYFENWGDFGFLMSTQMRNHAAYFYNWPDLYWMSEYRTGANLLEGLNLGEFFNKRVYSYIPAVHDGSKYGYYDWILNGADGVTMADFAMYPLDKVNPGASGWVAELVESGDEHETIYRIRLHSPNNEKLRPANREITYEDLATLQLDVAMVSDGQTYLIPARAVNVDGKYIEYDFYGDVWPTLEGNVRITGIKTKVVLPEGAETPVYDLWDMYTYSNLTDRFGITVKAPLTDYAGNGIVFGEKKGNVSLSGNMNMDRVEASITRMDFSSSAIDSAAMGKEANYADQFLTAQYYDGDKFYGDYVRVMLHTNETMMANGGAEAIGKVYLEWNVKDPDGNPARTYLDRVFNSKDHSVLYFDSLHIHPAMTPQGQKVQPVKVGNADLLADRVGNHGLQNEILLTGDPETSIHPESALYLDTTAPVVTTGDTVIRTKTTAQGKTEAVQLTIPFVVKDREKDESAAGMVSGASGTTGYIQLSDPKGRRNVNFRYVVTQSTDFPGEDAAWRTGNMSNIRTGYYAFGVGKDGENLYMHLELDNLTDYQFSDKDGLNVSMWMQDIAGNRVTRDANIKIPGVDNVGPEIKQYSSKVKNIGSGTGMLSANVMVVDLNGVSNVSHRWVDSLDSDKAYTDEKYEPDANGNYDESQYRSFSQEIRADGPVTYYLQVRTYDKSNNMTEATYTYDVDLTKAVSQYEFTGDITAPSNQPPIKVYAPVSSQSVAPDTAMSRVSIVRDVLVDGMHTNEIYFRLITAAEAADGVDLFDTNATWYKVNEYRHYSDGTYYDNVTKEEGTPGWASVYGELDVYIGSCLDGFSLDNIIVHPDGGTNVSYTWEKIGTVAYAPKTENVHSMSYTENVLYLYDSLGNATTGKWNDDYTYRYAVFNQDMSGVRVSMTLKNERMPAWGLQDIDFENSYAVLVKADQDGNLLKNEDGSYLEISDRQPLSYSLDQTLTVPSVDKDGLPFQSGAYVWVVTVAQKGGTVQTFDNCELYLILDAANAAERFGVLSFDRSIFAAYSYMGAQYITVTEEAEEGDVLPFINIGVAEPSQYLFEGSPEIQSVGGIQPYATGVTNSLDSNYEAHFTITADLSKEADFGTWLGQELGGVEAIRFWNAASEGDFANVSYIEGNYSSAGGAITAQFSKDAAAAKLDVNMNLGWFSELLGHAIVDAETLAATPKGNFRVQFGENRICYQLKMANGVESPVYQFDLNLITDAPEINVDLDFGPAYVEEELLVDDSGPQWIYIPIDVQHTEYTDLHFSNILSDYSGLEVYKVEFFGGFADESNLIPISEYDIRKLTDEELTNGYRLTNGNFQNRGLEGTRVQYSSSTYGYSTGGTDIYFIITDRSGNAATVFPLAASEFGIYYEDFSAKDVNYEGIYTAQADFDAMYDGLHALTLVDSLGYGMPEYIEITMDDLQSAKFDPENEFIAPNTAGVVGADSISRYDDQGAFVGDDDAIFITLPYDPNVPEGQSVAHTLHFKLVGEKDVLGETSYMLEKDFVLTGPNTKPAVVSAKTVPGCVYVTHNVPVILEDGSAGATDRILLRDNSLYGTDYEYTFTDVYGDTYTETIHIDEVTDPVITYSTTEPTTDPVIVTVTSPNALYVDEYNLEYGIYVSGNGTTELQLEMYLNDMVEVYFDEACTNFAAYVEVNNYFDTLEADPYIFWDYDAGDIQSGNVVYDEVTAYLVDRNGALVIDPATGTQAKFVFFPGGQTSYTFSGCYTNRGATLEDITATLEVTLEPLPIEEADTFAPEVDVIGYYTMKGQAQEANMVYRVATGRYSFPDYNVLYGEGCYQDNLVDMVANMGWVESYMFHLNIIDDSRVKLILRSDVYETNVGYNTPSQTIEGVKLVGRTLEISENTEFALYLVDEKGNTTALHFKVTTLTESAPTPELAIVQAQDALGNPTMRVYLLPPQLDGYSDLEMTNAEKRKDEETYEDTEIEGEFDLFSDYYGLYYLEFNRSGTVPVYWQYQYRGETYTGSLNAQIVMPDMTAPGVKTSDWSANYYSQPTNQDVVLKLKLTKPAKNVVAVYHKDGTEYLLSKTQLEAYGMLLSYMDDAVTVFFEKSTDAMFADLGTVSLRFTGLDNNQNGYYTVPAVKGIDRVAPVLSASVEYSANRKNAVITLTADEPVLNQATGRKGESFTFKVFANDTYTYQVVDLAGNRSAIDVTVDGLITEELKITLSTSASESGIIADPAAYQAEVGQTLYVRTNRASTVWVYGEQETVTVPAGPDTWAQVTVTENAMGLHPAIAARDDYENLAIVQLAYIPVKDVTAPTLVVHKQSVAVSANATQEQIRRSLLANIIYSDEITPADMLKVEVSYNTGITSGQIPVTYTVTDEAGNTATAQCWLRIRAGLVPEIKVNGSVVENGAYLNDGVKGPLTITVTFTADVAEPYKLVYEKGQYLNWAKLKDGTWITDGYEDGNTMTYTLEVSETGWYCIALITQSGEVYYFEVNISSIN